MGNDLAPFVLKAPKGTVLFREGDSGEEMYFIHSGKVRIEKQVDQKSTTLAILEKGDFFGEMSLLDRAPRSATAILDEDAELLRVDASGFQKLLAGNIEIAVRMIRKYTARLRDANERIETLLKDRTHVDREIAEILESVKGQPSGTAPEAELGAFVAENPGGGRFPVRKNTVLIGRRDPVTNLLPDIDLTDADLDRSVSRRHARLECAEGTFLLAEEVGVANGTFVNGVRIEPGTGVVLQPGDKVGFGKTSFRFEVS